MTEICRVNLDNIDNNFLDGTFGRTLLLIRLA